MKSLMEKMDAKVLGTVISVGEKSEIQPKTVGGISGSFVAFKCMNASLGVFDVVVRQDEFPGNALLGEKIVSFNECYLVPIPQQIVNTEKDERGNKQSSSTSYVEFMIYLTNVEFKEEN